MVPTLTKKTCIFRASFLAVALLATLTLPPHLQGQDPTPPGEDPAVRSLLASMDTSEIRSLLAFLETEEARVFLNAFRTISRYHPSSPEEPSLWEGATNGLIEALDDPYTNVFTPDQYGRFRETNTGDYAGIGVQITRLGGRVTVTAVFRETPAERAGMVVGDQIVWVEGDDASDWSLDQARDAIRGEPGSVVELRLARDGFDALIPMSIERDNVHVSAVAAAFIEEGVAHVAVDRFARGVVGELEDALTEFGSARAFILDMRGNPGGYLDEALQVADLFLAPGQTLASAEMKNHRGDVEKPAWSAQSPARIPDKPLIVLVDRFTASAAEIVTGALQDHDRALVLGERTLGKGAIQSVYPLYAGRQISITTGSWYTSLGRSLHRPRHRDGTLKPEGDENRERVATAAGRQLESGGGIFPDLEIADDTLAAEERALLNNANRAQAPFSLRIQEYAFELAKEALESRRVDRLPSSAFDGLAESLVEAGMDPEVVGDPVARAYLDWRVQVVYLSRANARGLALKVQSERDRVLAEALRLARSVTTSAELFAPATRTEG